MSLSSAGTLDSSCFNPFGKTVFTTTEGEKEGKNNEKKNEKENKGKECDGEGEKEEVWDGSGEGTHDLSTVIISLIFSLVL